MALFRGGYGKRIVFLGILTLCQVVPMYAIYTFGPQIMTEFGLGAGQGSDFGRKRCKFILSCGHIPGYVLA